MCKWPTRQHSCKENRTLFSSRGSSLRARQSGHAAPALQTLGSVGEGAEDDVKAPPDEIMEEINSRIQNLLDGDGDGTITVDSDNPAWQQWLVGAPSGRAPAQAAVQRLL